MCDYNTMSKFDMDKHIKYYPNWLEVVILWDGSIEYIIPDLYDKLNEISNRKGNGNIEFKSRSIQSILLDLGLVILVGGRQEGLCNPIQHKVVETFRSAGLLDSNTYPIDLVPKRISDRVFEAYKALIAIEVQDRFGSEGLKKLGIKAGSKNIFKYGERIRHSFEIYKKYVESNDNEMSDIINIIPDLYISDIIYNRFHSTLNMDTCKTIGNCLFHTWEYCMKIKNSTKMNNMFLVSLTIAIRNYSGWKDTSIYDFEYFLYQAPLFFEEYALDLFNLYQSIEHFDLDSLISLYKKQKGRKFDYEFKASNSINSTYMC